MCQIPYSLGVLCIITAVQCAAPGVSAWIAPGLERAQQATAQTRTMVRKEAEILIQLCKPPTIGILKLALLFRLFFFSLLLYFISLPACTEKYLVMTNLLNLCVAHKS